MRKFLLLLVGGLFAVNFAVFAQARGYGEAGMGKTRGDCMMPAGWHKMTGAVDEIDHARGTLTLKGSAVDMLLHFPSASIKDLKNGDTITVDLGFGKESPAPASGY